MDQFSVEVMVSGKPVMVSLDEVTGANSLMFHLMVAKAYCGRIWRSAQYGWQNDVNPKCGIAPDDVDMMIEGLMNWYPPE